MIPYTERNDAHSTPEAPYYVDTVYNVTKHKVNTEHCIFNHTLVLCLLNIITNVIKTYILKQAYR